MITVASTIKPPMWCPGRNGHPLWRGCVGYWPLWASAGTKAMDLSGNSNNGTIGASLTWLQTTQGIGVSCAAGGGINCGAGTALDSVVNEVSLEYVFVVTGTGSSYGRLSDKHPGPTIALSDGSRTVYFYGTIGGEARSLVLVTSAISLNVLYHLVVTYKNDSVHAMHTYLNGTLVATNTDASGAIATTTVPLYIGDRQAGSRPFLGSILLHAEHNIQLSPGAIAELAADPFCMIRPIAG